MRNVIGLVDLHHDISLNFLTENRSIASTQMLGRYCFIDFPLSNFSNSGIKNIGILIKEKPRSLFRHLGLKNPWAFNTKTGGITLLYNEKYANDKVYNTDVNNLLENSWYLKDNYRAKYIVVAPAHLVMTINYEDVVEKHIGSGAEITCVYKPNSKGRNELLSSAIYELDGERIISMKQNKGDKDIVNSSLSTYVINYDVFVSLLEKAQNTSSLFALKDIIKASLNTLKVFGYKYEGFVQAYDSLSAYLKNSLDLLNYENYESLFKPNWPIYTRTYDTPPVIYGKEAKISNCFIANGSQIEGEVENSIIGRGCVIEKGAVVKNTILLANAKVCEGVSLNNVVIDKQAIIKYTKKLEGTTENPIGIRQEDVA